MTGPYEEPLSNSIITGKYHQQLCKTMTDAHLQQTSNSAPAAVLNSTRTMTDTYHKPLPDSL